MTIELVVITLAAFLTAILTFFSGFGLGTILTPVFIIFFPVDLAIALTGVVHFFNNVFKLLLVGKKADRDVLLRFGIPAVVAAFAGAWLLLNVTELPPLFSYSIGAREFVVTPVKFVIAVLLIGFSVLELLPFTKKLEFGRDKLPWGGLLSGFFGGLSGHQGALRSAFLIKAGLSKETFIATVAVVSTFVDFTRLSVYATRFGEARLEENMLVVASATLAGIVGAYVGNALLKKVTIKFVQKLVVAMLIAISIALGLGLI